MKKQSPKPLKPSFWEGARTPVMIAHRGGDGAGIEKENSMAAFQAAYDLGYRWFETDVVPTKDGKLLAIHGRGYQLHPNKDLPSRLAVHKMTYEESKEKIKVGGEPPLLLEDLLDTFPDVRVFVDPKTFKAAPILAQFLIDRPSDLSRICVGSFHRRNTSLIYRRIYKATGQEVTYAAIGAFRGMLLVWSARLHLPTFWIRNYLKRTRTNTVYLPYKLVNKAGGQRIVDLAHSLSLKVVVYAPNDKDSIRNSLDRGVDGIMSDRLEILKRVLNT